MTGLPDDVAVRLRTFADHSGPSLAPYQDHNGFPQHDRLRYDLRLALRPHPAVGVERPTGTGWTIAEVQAEMLAVATAGLDGESPLLDEWPVDCRADVDRWQAVIRAALQPQQGSLKPAEDGEPDGVLVENTPEDRRWAMGLDWQRTDQSTPSGEASTGDCPSSPDHADILETIENASDAWQKNGYTSALAEVRDMANVGRALMEALPEGYSYMNCPSEIVSDLMNERDDALTTPSPSIGDVDRMREALEGLVEVCTNHELGEVDWRLALKDAREALAALNSRKDVK